MLVCRCHPFLLPLALPAFGPQLLFTFAVFQDAGRLAGVLECMRAHCPGFPPSNMARPPNPFAFSPLLEIQLVPFEAADKLEKLSSFNHYPFLVVPFSPKPSICVCPWLLLVGFFVVPCPVEFFVSLWAVSPFWKTVS